MTLDNIKEEILNSKNINYINKLPINGVKLSLLHILKYTDLECIFLK